MRVPHRKHSKEQSVELEKYHLTRCTFFFEEAVVTFNGAIWKHILLGRPLHEVRHAVQQIISDSEISDDTNINRRDPEPFDWYQRYSGVRDIVNQVSS